MERGTAKLPTDILELLDISWAPQSGGLGAFLPELLSCCEGWFECSGASIFLREGSSDAYVIAARAGSDAQIPNGVTIFEGQGIAGSAVKANIALLINDPGDHPLLAKRNVNRKEGIQSALVVPLAMPGAKALGVLNLSRREGQQQFNENDLRQAQALARYVALAVSNARMLDEIRASKAQADSARDRLQGVIDSLGVAVVIVDDQGALVGTNREAVKLLGQQLTRAPKVLKDALDKALATAVVGDVARFKPRDNSADRTWTVIATPVPSGGATAVIEEITESERAHAERARLNRLAEIGQMTAAIAHEIRNPLTGIRGAAQMVSISPEDAAKFGSVIEQEAIKLNSLCDQFLEFAKPIGLKRSQVKLNELARRLAAAHFRQFAAGKVTLELELADDEPTMDLDELRMEQVLRNLLLNALQASSAEKTVRLEVTAWGFVVEDDGVGMSPEVLDRLFTPFFTTKASGTGLGLSTVSKIVEAHGGTLSIRSSEGEGTRFEVVLEQAEGRLRLSA